MPVQLEHWIKLVNNRKAPYELREAAILHLTRIRDTIDKSLKNNSKGPSKHENLFTG
jgi:hypothetical protein